MNKILNWFQTRFQKKTPKRVFLNNRTINITPITYNEMLDVIFLILPYLKMVHLVRNNHSSDLPADVYFDIIENLILQLNRKDFDKIVKIFIKQDDSFIAEIQYKDFIMMLPVIMRENKIIETFILLRNLGAF